MKNLSLTTKHILGCLALPFVTALNAATVTTPYSENFSTLDTSTVASVFTETADTNWSVPSAGKYQYYTGLKNNAGSAMVTASDFGATYADFVVSTTFTVTSVSASGTSNWGMAILGDDETPSNYILIDFSTGDTLRAISLGGSGTGAAVNDSKTSSIEFAKNVTYTLTATGTYSGSSLTLEVDLTDGTNSDSIVATAFDASTFYTGSAMGLRARSGSGGGTVVQYDSFSIIPEPGTYALLAGFCMLGFVMLRRR